jgi:translation initiation factor IF-3
LRVNEKIIAREIRLVGEKGEQLGVMPTMQALEQARREGLDLVEVAGTSVPPVCRILDYGKFKYEKDRHDREARRSQKVAELREIRIRPKIGTHDFDAKARLAKKMLAEGDKVKVTVFFRGREVTHPQLGWQLLQKMLATLKEEAAIERQPLMEGNRMAMTLTAAKPKEPEKETKEAPKKEPPKDEGKDIGKGEIVNAKA